MWIILVLPEAAIVLTYFCVLCVVIIVVETVLLVQDVLKNI